MIEFDSSWNSNAEKHHLVPNTYLKAWSTDGKKVYFINKKDKLIDLKKK